MTAHASPFHLIGPALPEYSQLMSEPEGQRVLVIGDMTPTSTHLGKLCKALDIEVINVASHHELPFRLHHNRPLAVLTALPPETLAMSSILRCIAAYDTELPVLLLGDDRATLLGTIDAAAQLWGLSRLTVATLCLQPKALIDFLAKAGNKRGALHLMAVG